MQKYCHTVYKILVTIIAFTTFSNLYGQFTPTPQSTYTSGNGVAVASECRTLIRQMEQARDACKGVNDATFTVAFNYDVGGDYYFWWPSLKNKGIAKEQISAWFKLPSSSPGTASFTVPSGDAWAYGGFGKADQDGYMLVYSVTNKWIDSVAIGSLVREFPDFNPGAITTSSSTVCAGGSPLNITGAGAPSGGSGTYTYEWYRNSVKITGASSYYATYTPSVETTPGEYKYTRKVLQDRCNVGNFSTGTYTLTVVADPTITGITPTGPGTATICYNTDSGTLTATLSSIAVGGPYTYTWQKR
ncbi:MAG: hypothetical protein LBF69_03530, partial [Prevotellaceae bacterium]|nr:hypothetical protein [Prevotellaceae bacterium]